MKVVITAKNFSKTCPEAVEMLKKANLEVEDYSEKCSGSLTSEDTLYELVKDADIVVASLEPYTSSLLARLPKLKMISRRGIGYDSVDVEACKAHSITLTRTVGAVEGAVAEHVLAYLLYFGRRVDLQTSYMKNHEWNRFMVSGIKTRVLGLVGFGGIGKEIAKRAVPFGMKVYYYCRHPNKKWEEEYHVEYKELDELLSISDYVSVNVPYTPSTENMINSNFISKMKEGSIIINISRGAVQDDQAILDGILSHHLAGAAIDVFRKEPCMDSILMGYDNIILTPHTASYTTENFTDMNILAATNVVDYINENLNPIHVVFSPK